MMRIYDEKTYGIFVVNDMARVVLDENDTVAKTNIITLACTSWNNCKRHRMANVLYAGK